MWMWVEKKKNYVPVTREFSIEMDYYRISILGQSGKGQTVLSSVRIDQWGTRKKEENLEELPYSPGF